MTTDQAFSNAAEGDLRRASEEVTMQARARLQAQEADKHRAKEEKRDKLANEIADAREEHLAMQARPSILQKFLSVYKRK